MSDRSVKVMMDQVISFFEDHPECWAQGAYALDKYGYACAQNSEGAAQWCFVGKWTQLGFPLISHTTMTTINDEARNLEEALEGFRELRDSLG
jgi:hypothetical protein